MADVLSHMTGCLTKEEIKGYLQMVGNDDNNEDYYGSEPDSEQIKTEFGLTKTRSGPSKTDSEQTETRSQQCESTLTSITEGEPLKVGRSTGGPSIRCGTSFV